MKSLQVIDERALLKKFQSGDEQSFETIFQLNSASLTFFADKLLVNFDQANAQEIVLDTFLKLYDRRQSFDSLASIKAFLYISVKNGCLNSIEKEKVRLRRFDTYARDLEKFEENVLSKIVHTEVIQETALCHRSSAGTVQAHYGETDGREESPGGIGRPQHQCQHG